MTFEVEHNFPNLGKRVMLLNARRIIQLSNNENLILLAIEDITERLHQELTEKSGIAKVILRHKADKEVLNEEIRKKTTLLLQQNIQLEKANKELNTFTYISSHDLQEPLRKIQTFVELLKKEKQNLSQKGIMYFESIHETASQMKTLLEDLLKYSRLTKEERVFELTDLNTILEEVKRSFMILISQKKAVIKADKLCSVPIIPFEFRQLLENLFSNWLKFSKPDVPPRLTIKSKIVNGSKVKGQMLSDKINYCHLIFTDNGIGFDSQYKDKVFEVFQRLHPYDQYNGTGIGLAICKRIVENHNGMITATGTLGKGARFDIYIPV
jgi:two-component system CheB/CheR fusion protein